MALITIELQMGKGALDMKNSIKGSSHEFSNGFVGYLSKNEFHLTKAL